jgi:hypothetical protein
MVAEFWSEMTQGEICQMKNGLVFEKKGMLPQWEPFWWFPFLLVAGGATKDGAFLLSEVELIRVGSIIAYLAISWARVVDLNPRAEIGPAAL